MSDLPSALRNGLEELAITIEHVDWMKDLMSGRYPEPVAQELIEHLQEEEHQHELSLTALAGALRSGDHLDPALSDQLDREIFNLHLMQDHFNVIRAVASSSVSRDMAAKLQHHIEEEEDRHLLGLRGLYDRLSSLQLDAAAAADGAPADGAPPQATVGELVVRADAVLPRLGSLVGEPMSTGRVQERPLPPTTWSPGATVGSLKDPRL